jgi:hypothetical protein
MPDQQPTRQRLSYTGAVHRDWNVSIAYRPDYCEAVITHQRTGESRETRIFYADYQDGSIWPRQYEAQGVLVDWIADMLDHVGDDDEEVDTPAQD